MSVARIKRETDEAVVTEEKDMTHYIKDRVELIRQVFSVLRERELLAMAPASLRSLPVDQLQELCLDEVLGISSKRLCSILDGYECPSDTDSDCPDTANMETLSLDSISSAEEDLHHTTTKRKKKDKHHKKHKRRATTGSEVSSTVAAEHLSGGSKKNKKDKGPGGEGGGGSTAGMTVLELLELQMRAKAIRAQLQSVQASGDTASDDDGEEERRSSNSKRHPELEGDDDDEVEIKEEKPEVVEIITSSDEEKTTVKEEIPEGPSQAKKPHHIQKATSDSKDNNQQPTGGVRKIKLNRNKLLVSLGDGSRDVKEGGEGETDTTKLPSNDLRNLLQRKKNETTSTAGQGKTLGGGRQYRERRDSGSEKEEGNNKISSEQHLENKQSNEVQSVKRKKRKRDKDNKKTDKKRKSGDKGKECDEDEILLELSDTEKMFDSESSGESDSEDSVSTTGNGEEDEENQKDVPGSDVLVVNEREMITGSKSEKKNETSTIVVASDALEVTEVTQQEVSTGEEAENVQSKESVLSEKQGNESEATVQIMDSGVVDGEMKQSDELIQESVTEENSETVANSIQSSHKGASKGKKKKHKSDKTKDGVKKKLQKCTEDLENSETMKVQIEKNSVSRYISEDAEGGDENKPDLSEGECSDSSDDVEIMEAKGEDVVCISDVEDLDSKKRDDNEKTNEITLNIEDLDHNMEENKKEHEGEGTEIDYTLKKVEKESEITKNVEESEEDDVVFEISDESSRDSDVCRLSKEPSREEILELSRKLEREMEMADCGGAEEGTVEEEEEGTHTWKKRWLDSDKVRSVLRTSSLFNAVRRKNMELRKKLKEGSGQSNEQVATCEEAKIPEAATIQIEIMNKGDETGQEESVISAPTDSSVGLADNSEPVETSSQPECGNSGEVTNSRETVDVNSVEFYKSLPSGSRQFSNHNTEEGGEEETKKMAKDARQLMKMYRKLLKMNREVNEKGEKKKKKEGKSKKKKKSKDKCKEEM